MTGRTVGVEEELMLVHPETGRLVAVSSAAVAANHSDVEVEQELFLQQIETSTPPCATAQELRDGVRAGRRAVGRAAAAAGARAVAVPAPVLAEVEEDITPKPRYRRIARSYGEMARQSLVSAMHVHVQVDGDEEGVTVVDGIRPWLPVLVALSANSPFWQGRDTLHASWRSQVWSRWPTAGPSQPFGDATTYRAVAEAMTGWGAALDPGMLYYDVRLSASYPTVEIRVADVCTDIDDVLLVALLARALVSTIARSGPVGGRRDATSWRTDLLRAAGWRAARFGLADRLVHPVSAELVPAREVVAATLDHVREALADSGDGETVGALADLVLGRGTGAARQRQVHSREGGLAGVVHDLARRTEDSWA
ncbi:MAG: glutamate--cysteine ligase [Nocardioidaceae bacterium]